MGISTLQSNRGPGRKNTGQMDPQPKLSRKMMCVSGAKGRKNLNSTLVKKVHHNNGPYLIYLQLLPSGMLLERQCLNYCINIVAS